jgi:MYXO-CTERM domain-containing protein
MSVLSARDADACGMFVTRPMTDEEIAQKVPYLSIERVLLVWNATTQTEDFVREARFEKANQAFGFVVPVPSRPEVFAVAKSPFDDLSREFPFTLPRLTAAGFESFGGGVARAPPPVVLSEQRIGSFRAFVLAASDGGGLADWLKKNGFGVPVSAQAWLDHFVRLGFHYVAFRYDAEETAQPGMTSETVRIRFKTPMPYYPYLEPQRSSTPTAARNLLLWYVSQEERAPVASSHAGDGALVWRQPWEGTALHVTAKRVRDAIPSLAELVSGDDGSPWVVSTYRDAKQSREGWGDVLLVPTSPVAMSDEAIASRWRLLPVLDPRLEGALDERPLEAASFVTSAVAPPIDASPASSPEKGTRRGCEVASGSDDAASDGVILLVLVCAVVTARRRRAMAALAVVAILSCKRDPPAPPMQRQMQTHTVNGSVVAFMPDGNEVLVAEGSDVHVYDIASGTERARFNVTGPFDGASYEPFAIFALLPLPGRRALVGSNDRAIRHGMLSLYDVDRGREVWRKDVTAYASSAVGNFDPVRYPLAVSSDGHRALAADADGMILWNVDASEQVTHLRSPQPVRHLAFLGNDRALAIGEAPYLAANGNAPDDPSMHVWDLVGGTEQRAFVGSRNQVLALAATPDGKRAVTIGMEAALRVWDVDAGREVLGLDVSDMTEGQGSRGVVAISRDGTRAYTLFGPRGACAWDIEAGALLDCEDRNGFNGGIALSPDGGLLAFAESTTRGGLDSIHYWQVPRSAASSVPPTWPRVPPWPSRKSYIMPVVAPSEDDDRVVRERAVVALMFGRVSASRIGVDAKAQWSPPAGDAELGPVTAEGPTPANTEQVTASLRPSLRLCYRRGLASDPKMAGNLSISARIGPNGEVKSAEATKSAGVSASVIQCVLSRVRNAQFDSPGPKGSTLRIPVSFVTKTK